MKKANRTNKNRTHKAKKIVFSLSTMLCAAEMMSTYAYASANANAFINTAVSVLKSVLYIVGGALAVFGVLHLIESYTQENPAAKAQGIKQLAGGIGVIVASAALIPVLGDMMRSAF